MKYLAIAAVAALLGQALPSVAAPTPPIVSVACSAGITNCSTAADGVSPANGTEWRNTGTTAYWNPTADTITFALDTSRTLTGVTAILDNNDSYSFQSLIAGNWTTFLTILSSEGSVTDGVEKFTRSLAAPVTTSSVRLIAFGGDGNYGVGEVSFTVAAVPEPSTIALLASGIGLVGFVAARRRRIEA